MAPPRHRRPGYSRRAQYGLFAGYVLAVSGVVIAIALVLIARFDPAGFGLIRGGMLDLTAPATSAGRGAVDGIGSVGATVGQYLDAGRQNGELHRALDDVQVRLVAARAAEFENRRLKATLRLVERTAQPVVATRIIGSTAISTRRLATLAAGSADGVHPGQPVRAPEGLLGRTFEAGTHFARLLLVTDSASTVPVRLARSGLPALATGTGDGVVRLRALIAGENPFRRGDLAITSGTGGVFPPDVPVAVVVRVDADGAVARPLADPATVDFALVQRPYATEALRPPPGLAPPAK